MDGRVYSERLCGLNVYDKSTTMQNSVLTIESVVDCKNCPHAAELLFEFDMALKAMFGKDHAIFGEIIELIKNIVHLYNKSFTYNKKESGAIFRLKNELIKSGQGGAVKMPSRHDCEKLFQEFLQEAGILTRRTSKILQSLLGVSRCRYEDIIKLYEDQFGYTSDEAVLLKENKAAFDYLLALRGEIEHPMRKLEKEWLKYDNSGNVVPANFVYKSEKYIVREYLSETAEFLFFLTEFLIATGISYKMPGIKYKFNPNPKEGEFRWQSYIVHKTNSTN